MTFRNNNQSRRGFIKKSLLTASLVPLMNKSFSSMFYNSDISSLKIHIFSKHLQFLNYKDAAEAAAEMGFDGIDLTVRPNGHVLPERVESDLPEATEAMRKVGLVPLLMTSAVQDANNSIDRKVLEVAAQQGIKYYRMNWYSYPEDKSIPESLQYFQQKVKDVSHLNKELGLIGCYQNHAGNGVGSSIWELWELLREADKQYMGLQYDIRYAVVEGGMSWQNALRLVQPQIKTIAVKDFLWEKKNGTWDTTNIPVGEGMIDFKTYFKLFEKIQGRCTSNAAS